MRGSGARDGARAPPPPRSPGSAALRVRRHARRQQGGRAAARRARLRPRRPRLPQGADGTREPAAARDPLLELQSFRRPRGLPGRMRAPERSGNGAPRRRLGGIRRGLHGRGPHLRARARLCAGRRSALGAALAFAPPRGHGSIGGARRRPRTRSRRAGARPSLAHGAFRGRGARRAPSGSRGNPSRGSPRGGTRTRRRWAGCRRRFSRRRSRARHWPRRAASTPTRFPCRWTSSCNARRARSPRA